MNNEIIKFVNGDLQLDVGISPEQNTVWLTADQICQLFDKNKSTISRHIKNIFTKCCRKVPRFSNGDIRRLIQYLYC